MKQTDKDLDRLLVDLRNALSPMLNLCTLLQYGTNELSPLLMQAICSAKAHHDRIGDYLDRLLALQEGQDGKSGDCP